MHTTRIALLLSSAAGIAGCFFVWTKNLVFGQPNVVLGIQYSEGPLAMICFICVAGLVLLNFKSNTPDRSLTKTMFFSSMLAIVVTVYKIYAVHEKAGKIAHIQADIHQLVVYEPANGLYFTLSAAISIVLILIVQSLVYRRALRSASAWMNIQPRERFYIPTSQ